MHGTPQLSAADSANSFVQVMRSEDDIAFTIIGNCCGCTGYHLDIYEAHKEENDQPVGSIEKM